MIFIALGFGLWFCAVMAVGEAFRWSVPARLGTLLSGPAIALLATVLIVP